MPPLDIGPLLGRRFGHLTILGMGAPIGNDSTVECRCDCGVTATKRWRCVQEGKTRSCGHLARADVASLVGHRFGMFTVVAPAPRGLHGRARLVVLCDCGTARTVLLSNLRRGLSRSCGCLRGLRPTGQAPLLARAGARQQRPIPDPDPMGRLSVLREVPSDTLRRLTAMQREAVTLLRQGLRPHQIAQVRGVSRATVTIALRRAVKHLTAATPPGASNTYQRAAGRRRRAMATATTTP